MFKNLVIIVSVNLKLNDHINYINEIASISSYQTFKMFKYNTITTLIKLFTIYVRRMSTIPHFVPLMLKRHQNFDKTQKNFHLLILNRCNISNS